MERSQLINYPNKQEFTNYTQLINVFAVSIRDPGSHKTSLGILAPRLYKGQAWLAEKATEAFAMIGGGIFYLGGIKRRYILSWRDKIGGIVISGEIKTAVQWR